MNMELDFTDYKTYMQWRASWVKAYDELSEQIRQLKQLKRDTQRSSQPVYPIEHKLAVAKKHARLYLELREASKVRSGQQRSQQR